MKNISLLPLVLMLVAPAINLSAQNTEMDRINAYKIAFFTRRLNLTPAEAEKFWPVYNEYDNKRIDLQKQRSETMRMINLQESKMSDAELLKSADRIVALQVDEALLTESLHKRLKEILPARKVIRVYQAENLFRNQLLNELRETRGEIIRRQVQPSPPGRY